jgi:hypothetical protein
VIALGAQMMPFWSSHALSERAGFDRGLHAGSWDTKYYVYILCSLVVFRPLLSWLLFFPLGMGLRASGYALIDQVTRLGAVLGHRFRSWKGACQVFAGASNIKA